MRRVPVNRTINIICGVFLVCGLAFLGISIYTVRSTRSFVAQAETVRGEVVDLEYRRDNSGSSASGGAYYPVVKYRTAAGDQRTLYGNTGSSPPSYRVGEAVDVLYDPTNPSDARIAGFFSIWLVPLIAGVLGWLFSLASGGVMIARRVAARRVRDLPLYFSTFLPAISATSLLAGVPAGSLSAVLSPLSSYGGHSCRRRSSSIHSTGTTSTASCSSCCQWPW
jgi:Protein of unknown function (DUF3592)